MQVYTTTKARFIEDAESGDIANYISDAAKACGIPVSRSEYRSWVDSCSAISKMLGYTSIPDDTCISMEYFIPFTIFRTDFCITGIGPDGRPVLIIIEMKAWDGNNVHLSNSSSMVRVDFYDRGEVLHPSYQAWSYANYIHYFNSEVVDGQIDVVPCVYLNRCSRERKDEVLEDERYSECVTKAPIFYYQDVKALAKFISDRIFAADGGTTFERIDNGRLTIDSSLQKSLRRVLTERDYFAPMEDQVIVYNALLHGTRDALDHRKKKVYIVRGGPGTGKSVLALKLLSELAGGYDRGKEHVFTPAVYVTKTSAPRATYKKDLEWLAKQVGCLDPMFAGASSFYGKPANDYPVLIVDEAHRLAKKSFALMKGENQVKEIINAAQVSIFFIDEHQNVSMADIGTVEEIKKWAREYEAQVIDGLVLKTQFRCSGSDAYLKWLDHTLNIPTEAPSPTGDLGYKVTVVDSVPDLLNVIDSRRAEGKSARILAGYCWEWKSNGKPDKRMTDFNLGGADLRWNSNTESWSNDDRFIGEVGCIHSSQGMEFQVAGVIIGDDLVFREGGVKGVPEARSDLKGTMYGYEKDRARAELIIKNTYYTLMSRGQEECIVYCTDRPLADHIRSCLAGHQG